MDKNLIKEIKITSLENEERSLNKFAKKSKEATYLNNYKDDEYDLRLSFARDIDRIIHSNSYTRYIGKAQVHIGINNDMISTRSTHVQFVARVSRTIARALNLNEDLCEAISLGHDLGHTPFGHVGERILNKLSYEKLGEYFNHNIQSVRTLLNVENKGNGLNISLEVLDGIMSHNGEFLLNKYMPASKSVEEFFNEYNLSYTDESVIKQMRPMTLEGCIVRISDMIAYLGKDIEDAIKLNRFTTSELDEEIIEYLGVTNSQIMTSMIGDIIENSYGKDHITMSENMFRLINKAKALNYKKIYRKAHRDYELLKYEDMFTKLYDIYFEAIADNDLSNSINKNFLSDKCDKYLNETCVERKIIDYLAGMTDRYITSEYEKYVTNK